jgi:hypothetical protein
MGVGIKNLHGGFLSHVPVVITIITIVRRTGVFCQASPELGRLDAASMGEMRVTKKPAMRTFAEIFA